MRLYKISKVSEIEAMPQDSYSPVSPQFARAILNRLLAEGELPRLPLPGCLRRLSFPNRTTNPSQGWRLVNHAGTYEIQRRTLP